MKKINNPVSESHFGLKKHNSPSIFWGESLYDEMLKVHEKLTVRVLRERTYTQKG